MTHKEEIIRWANCPDGTKVWHKKENEDWELPKYSPSWMPNIIYIVNDEWAEFRKAQIDGAKLQYLDNSGYWVTTDNSPTIYNNIAKWRIKPEPVYEWQWIWKDENNKYYITQGYYSNKNELYGFYKKPKSIEPYEPSKKKRR